MKLVKRVPLRMYSESIVFETAGNIELLGRMFNFQSKIVNDKLGTRFDLTVKRNFSLCSLLNNLHCLHSDRSRYMAGLGVQ